MTSWIKSYVRSGPLSRITRSRLDIHKAARAQRHYASDVENGSSSTTTQAKYTSRLKRMNDRLPRFLRHYTTPLLSAPVSHVTAFLVLHEITALAPLIALAAAFHYFNWLPEQMINGQWIQAGVEKWGRYFEKKGWVEFTKASSPNSVSISGGEVTKDGQIDADEIRSRGAGWNVVLEVATAWAVVKALLPVRIVGSVWMTPWFARVAIVPIMRVFGRAGSKVA